MIRLPRLPWGWKEQPQLFERYWDETMSQIEKNFEAAKTAQAAADAGQIVSAPVGTSPGSVEAVPLFIPVAPGYLRVGSGLTGGGPMGNNVSVGVDTSVLMLRGNNLSDLTNVATARTNLGLGTAATIDSSSFVPSSGPKTISGHTVVRNNESNNTSLETYNNSATGYGVYFSGGSFSRYALRITNYSGTALFDVDGGGTVQPGADNSQTFGSSAFRWLKGFFGKLMLHSLDTYDTDALAAVGGLSAGEVYKTTTGELRVKL